MNPELIIDDAGVAHGGVTLARARLLVPLSLVLALAAAIPILIVKTPIMIDFFNHLARIYVLAHRDDPLLARYYSVHWRFIPNLAMDFTVPPLARLVGIYAAGKIFVLITMAALVGGVYATAAALRGRVGLWQTTAFLFLYNWIFLYGFINYLFGVALALWAFAAWIRLRDRPPIWRGLTSLVLVLLLYACHLYTVGIYGLAVLSYEIWRLRQAGRLRWARLAADLVAVAAPFLVVLLLLAASPTGGYASETYWRLPEKLDGLYFLVKTFWAPADLAFAAFCGAVALWGIRTGRLSLHPAALPLLLLGFLTYLAMPTKLFGSGIADMRLPIAILYLVIAMSRWEARGLASARILAGLILLAALLRFTEIGLAWRAYDREVGEFSASFAQIAPGSRVLVAGDYREPTSFTRRTMLQHMPCLVVIERSSLEPLLFAHPGKQVLNVAPAYEPVALAEPMPPDIADLVAVTSGSGNPPALPPDEAIWRDWRRDYDYVYVLYAGADRPLSLPGLVPLAAGKGFQLFRIEH